MIIGLSINMLICPYDNSKTILRELRNIDSVLARYCSRLEAGESLEEDLETIRQRALVLSSGIRQYGKQKLFLQLRRQERRLQLFRECETVVYLALAYMQVLQQVQPEAKEVICHHTQNLRQQRENLQQLLESVPKKAV